MDAAYRELVRRLRLMDLDSVEAMFRSLYAMGESNNRGAEAMAEVLSDGGRSNVIYELEYGEDS